MAGKDKIKEQRRKFFFLQGEQVGAFLKVF